MGDIFQSIVGWQFLNEPAYRWLIFVGMMILFLVAWHSVLRHM
jgi:hypothetical protein